jgi:hypothetical protein
MGGKEEVGIVVFCGVWECVFVICIIFGWRFVGPRHFDMHA